MIIVVAGPSGSGKTTFINCLSRCINALKIIMVDVVSSTRKYIDEIGRRNINYEDFQIGKKNSRYTSVYTFESSIYGFKLPEQLNEEMYVIDYPGDYPKCHEFQSSDWIGILILPPSEDILCDRLNQSGRSCRIMGARDEYFECLSDMDSGLFKNWIIVINNKEDDIKNGVDAVVEKLYLRKK